MTELVVDEINAANPNSRFKVLDTPILAPGTCIMCKSPGGDDRKFIDLGITVDWFGCLYFCTFCITEAASLIGLGNIEVLKEIMTERSNIYQKALYANAELQEQLNAARTLLRNCTCSSDGNSEPESNSDVEADSVPDESSEEPDESGSVEGPSSLPIIAEFDFDPPKPTRRRTSKSSE